MDRLPEPQPHIHIHQPAVRRAAEHTTLGERAGVPAPGATCRAVLAQSRARVREEPDVHQPAGRTGRQLLLLQPDRDEPGTHTAAPSGALPGGVSAGGAERKVLGGVVRRPGKLGNEQFVLPGDAPGVVCGGAGKQKRAGRGDGAPDPLSAK